MPLNLSTIQPAVLKTKEVASSGFVLPAEVANAINTTTIDGAKITTGSHSGYNYSTHLADVSVGLFTAQN